MMHDFSERLRAARKAAEASYDFGCDEPEMKAPEAPSSAPPPRNDIVTEDSAACEFAEIHGERLRYCHDTGSWYEWTGVAWRQNRVGMAFQWARELVRQLIANESPKARYLASKTSFAAGVEKFCRHDRTFAVTAETWDADRWLLGTPGGTVDLRTGRLREADQGERITKLTAVAPARLPDCPLWLAFLTQATGGDEGLTRFLRQWCGYALTGTVSEHALVFVYGPGGNGKSVFLNVLTGILAEYAKTAAMDTFTASKGDRHPTDMAMLRGARLVTASETEEGRPWAEAKIKQLTGGDPVTARFMRQDFFTFTPTFKLTIVGNHQPLLRNVDDAARRRFNIVPFTRKPERPDPHLEAKLRAEWPAILRWMIEGCLDWQQNGLVRPASVTEATEAYFAEQDLLGQWIADECVVRQGDPHCWDRIADLYASWCEYARAAGDEPGTVKAFGPAMRRKGFQDKRTNQAKGFAGIRVKVTPSYGHGDQ
ncbi:phage/plasmid primase, P4 family [Methylobacterium nodulans]|uniref:Phage/plasmid primase, P4 family n=1 Tax=Methylobacterium nodulans (strain LMG 21967 / CNCM I-2342 / ORS 2060) TaxID=460265 RepID=B8IXV3_METNO|nr:phage/plasmid primase, P4 family [Methylobacterium nodulans]ACL63243.1 phage/plasmid primase, P4 family [Methylobacterium nodulans ORS 2060]